MNNFGPMKPTLRRVTEYQEVTCTHVPGYGEDFYRLGVKEGDVYLEDVFEIRNDGHLNAAVNSLMKRAIGC